MAPKYSTGHRNFVQRDGSVKQAYHNGKFKIYSSTVPADADAAATGTLLCLVTNSSGANTPEVLSTGTATLTGAGGQVDSITVDGVNILGEVVPYATGLTETAAACAAAINKNLSTPNYTATSVGAIITFAAMPNTGTSPNTKTVACNVSGGTLGSSKTDMAGGVASVNGLPLGDVTAGELDKTGIWSGVNVATGVASYWRYESTVVDSGGISTTLIRTQGTCGTSGADYNMGSTTLTAGKTHTIDTGSITLPAS